MTMPPLAGQFHSALRAVLRRLPIADYYKTRLWATSLARPIGRVPEWPYYRAVELAMRGIANRYGEVGFSRSAPYSMLEFGVANGASLQLMLHFRDVWQRRLRLDQPVEVLGFDTFEGLPAPREGDRALYYREGDCPSRFEDVQDSVVARFERVRLVRGLFADTLPHERGFLLQRPPVFVSIDCDYYSATIDVLDALLPDIVPHGCMFYFDDVSVNFGSDLTGELRAIREVNEGAFGPGIRLIEYPLHVETGEMRHYRQLYRFFKLEEAERLGREMADHAQPFPAPRRGRLSPL